jgi:hypothetical protein
MCKNPQNFQINYVKDLQNKEIIKIVKFTLDFDLYLQ